MAIILYDNVKLLPSHFSVQTAPMCHTDSKFELQKLAEAEAEAAEPLPYFLLKEKFMLAHGSFVHNSVWTRITMTIAFICRLIMSGANSISVFNTCREIT